MNECDRDKYVMLVYRYQQEIPLKNNQLSRHYNIEQIAALPDNVLSKYYYYILERLEVLREIKREQDAANPNYDREIDDSKLQYAMDTYEEDHGLGEEPTLLKENFLGVKEPNQVEKVLAFIKNQYK